MKKILLAVVVAAPLALLALGGVRADDFVGVTTISSTMGNNAYRLCVGGGRASANDVGCPTFAPSLTTAGVLVMPADGTVSSVSGQLTLAPFNGKIAFGSVGAAGMRASNNLGLASNAVLNWSANVNNFFSAVQDVGLARQSAGVLRVTDASTGLGDLWAGTISATDLYVNGNVGIGATAPANSLTVVGDASFTTVNAAEICDETGANCSDVSAGLGGASVTGYTSGSLVFTDQSGNLYGSNTLVVDSSGKVGIGTASPGAALDIKPSGTDIFYGRNSAGSLRHLLEVDGSGYARQRWYDGSGAVAGYLATSPGDSSYFDVGNFGIGTKIPQTTLEVDGTISATTVTATTVTVDGEYLNLAHQYAKIRTTYPGSGLQVQIANGSYNPMTLATSYISIGSYSGIPLLSGRSGGWGIGTGSATPANSLTVVGDASFTTVNAAEICDETGANCSDLSGGLGSTVSDGVSGSVVFRDTDGSLTANSTFVVSSSGYVGIGTDSPLAKLHSDVGSSSTGTVGHLVYGSTSGGTFTTPSGSTQNRATFVVGTNWGNSNGGTHGLLNIYNANGSKLFVTAAGNVGIGTISPSSALDVNSIVTISGTTPRIILVDSDTGADSWIDANSSVGNLALSADRNAEVANSAMTFSVDGAEIMRMKDGNVGVKTSSPNYTMQLHEVDDHTILQLTNPTTGSTAADGSYIGVISATSALRIMNQELAALEMYTNGVNRLHIAETGKVGISTTIPQTALEVNGTISATDLYVNGVQVTGGGSDSLFGLSDVSASIPSSGQVLRYNGSKWEAVGVSTAMSATTMTSNFPDAIRCIDASGNETVFYATVVPLSGGTTYRYRTPYNGADLYIDYNASGTKTGGNASYSTATCNLSISGLYSAGRAFNFIGGQTWSQNTSNGNIYYTGGNVGIGTTTPSSSLDVQRISTAGNGEIARFVSMPANARVKISSITGGSAIDFDIAAQTNDSATKALTFSAGGTEWLRLAATGNVGIGTANPTSSKLQVDSSTGAAIRGTTSAGGGAIAVYGATSNVAGHAGLFHNTGSGYYCYMGYLGSYSLACSGPTSGVSDERLKKNISPLSNSEGLVALMKITPVHYNWKDPRRSIREIGFLAQDVEKSLPELVGTMELSDPSDPKSLKNIKVLQYDRLAAPIIKAIQELKVWNDAQQAEIDELKKANARLMQRLEALEARMAQ